MNLDTRPELDYDLTIIRTTRRGAGCGTWVIGRLDGCRFDALVFPQHAADPDSPELEKTRARCWEAHRPLPTLRR